MGIDAVHLYDRMPEQLRNEITHTCVLNACSHSGLVDQARTIFTKIPDKTEIISTTMVNFSSDQCQSFSSSIRSIALAVRHFSPMPENWSINTKRRIRLFTRCTVSVRQRFQMGTSTDLFHRSGPTIRCPKWEEYRSRWRSVRANEAAVPWIRQSIDSSLSPSLQYISIIRQH